jgi:hypothetical protein
VIGTFNIPNEIVAALVGILTTVVIPWLNRKFNTNINPNTVGNAVTEILEKKPASAAQTPPAHSTDVVPPNENGAM